MSLCVCVCVCGGGERTRSERAPREGRPPFLRHLFSQIKADVAGSHLEKVGHAAGPPLGPAVPGVGVGTFLPSAGLCRLPATGLLRVGFRALLAVAGSTLPLSLLKIIVDFWSFSHTGGLAATEGVEYSACHRPEPAGRQPPCPERRIRGEASVGRAGHPAHPPFL